MKRISSDVERIRIAAKQEGRQEVVAWLVSRFAEPDWILDEWQSQLREWGIHETNPKEGSNHETHI